MAADRRRTYEHVDLKSAQQFLRLLDSNAIGFSFQTFDDSKECRDPKLTQILHGPLDKYAEELIASNGRGAGVFVTINETDLRGRKATNIIGVRAVWQDDDDGFTGNYPLPPSIVVETSTGKFQRYWLVRDLAICEHPTVMERFVADYGSDPNAKDSARVMRLPGFFHRKGKPFLARIVESKSRVYTRGEILEAFPPVSKDDSRQRSSGSSGTSNTSSSNRITCDLLAALVHIPALDRGVWLRVGMALHDQFGGSEEGFAIWNEWSQTAPEKFDYDEQVRTWHGFKSGGGVTIASLFALAKEHGWRRRPSSAEDDFENGSVSNSDGNNGGSGRESAATNLVELGRDKCKLFHDTDRHAYATFETDGHRECWPIKSKGFGEWLSHQFFRHYDKVPVESSLKSAISTLTGQAKFEGEERAVHLRVAQNDGVYWLDFSDSQWRAIEITASGWRIVDQPPIRFVRPDSMRSLPIPATGGDLSELWNLVNIPKEDRLILLAWMLECLRPETPFPVLELIGEQGSAKSTTQSLIRELIDPNKSNLRSPPKASDDLAAMALHSHVVSFENVSHLSDRQQDDLCRLATGSGFSRRTLYTNFDESVIEIKRPVALNGIAATVTREDLLDRTISISLPRITERRTINELMRSFDVAKSQIFAGLLDLMVLALKELPEIKIAPSELPRMADFARLGEAVAMSLGKEPGIFLTDYGKRRRDAIQRILEGSPIAMACIALLEDRPEGFNGTVGVLFELLTNCYRTSGEFAWAKSPRGLSNALRRLAPAFRQIGITVDVGTKRTAQGYMCRLRRQDQSSDGV